MCLAVPGKIIARDGDNVVVDYDIEKRQGRIVDGEYAVGEYVILQGGIVVAKVPEGEALAALSLYRGLGD